jgi:hypothetical protein
MCPDGMVGDDADLRMCKVFQPAVAAHRGASRRYPENTLAAVKEAINIAMEHPEVRFFIEVDVRSTVDGELVLMHDSNVGRTTIGVGHVEEMTWPTIQGLKVRPVSQIVSAGQICTDRVPNPFLPITEVDLHVPTLENVIGVIREANEVRAVIGSPIGLLLEIKPLPPAGHFFPRLMEQVAGFLSGILDRLGLGRMADYVQRPTPSVLPLAKLLNDVADGDDAVPMLVFSSAGGIGKRDLGRLWDSLTGEAKHKLFDSPQMVSVGRYIPFLSGSVAESLGGNAPHPVPFGDATRDMPLATGLKKMVRFANMFWVIGSLNPSSVSANEQFCPAIQVVSTWHALNDPGEIQAAMKSDVTLISSDYPERVIQIAERSTQPSGLQEGAGVRFPDVYPEGGFALGEAQRRLGWSYLARTR